MTVNFGFFLLSSPSLLLLLLLLLLLFHLFLFFSDISVRQKVLERKNHELVWPGKGTFKLTVQLPPAPHEVHDISEGKIPTKVSKGVSIREDGYSSKVSGMGSAIRKT